MINAKGGIVDEFYHHPDYENARDWESGITAKTIIEESGWTATIAIPWQSLGRSLSPGMEIKANFIRRRAGAGATAWSPLPYDWDGNDMWRDGRSILGSLWFLED